MILSIKICHFFYLAKSFCLLYLLLIVLDIFSFLLTITSTLSSDTKSLHLGLAYLQALERPHPYYTTFFFNEGIFISQSPHEIPFECDHGSSSSFIIHTLRNISMFRIAHTTKQTW